MTTSEKGTTSTELNCLLNKCLEGSVVHPLGVFAADKVPYEKLLVVNEFGRQDTYGFIVNTDVATKSGEHWLAFLYRGGNVKKLEYFDSYGLPIESYPNVFNHMSHYIPIITCNTDILQSNETYSCGDYCIYFLGSRAACVSRNRFLSFLRTKHNGPSNNRDAFVEYTVSKLRCAAPCNPYQCSGDEQCCCARSCKAK